MSVAFILNPGYNTINNVHHTFWDQGADCVANESLNPVLEVATSLSAPSHIVTGGTDPAQLYMSDPITLSTDAPQFQAPILLAPTSKLQLVDEFEPTTGITFSKDIHMTYSATASNIDGVGELTCDTLNYTTLNPPITPGDASNWSNYKAISNVDLDGNNLLKVQSMNIASVYAPVGRSQIEFNNNVSFQNHNLYSVGALSYNNSGYGTSGQLLASQGSAINPIWVDAPSASNWSSYAASSDVDVAGFSIKDTVGNAVNIQGTLSAEYSGGDSVVSSVCLPTVGTESNHSVFEASLNNGTTTSILDLQVGNPLATKNDENYALLPGIGALIAVDTTGLSIGCGNTSSVLLTYSQGAKAVELNTYGALAFNSACNTGDTPPTVGDFGTSGQIIQSNGDAAPPSWVAAPSASNWSTYDATSDVDLASYSLTDSLGDVKINKPIVLTNTDNKKTKLISLESPIDNNTVQTAISLSSNTGYATQSVVQVISNPITTTAVSIGQRSGGCIRATDGDTSLVPSGSGSVRLAYSAGTKATTINSSGALAFNSGYTGGVFTEGNFGTTGYVAASAGSSSPPTWSDVNTLITSTDNVLYVSKNGGDSNKGTIALQYLTIQAAINSATLRYPQQVVILIAPGVYSGNLSITKPNVTLLGYSPSSQQNLLTQIVGNVSIACTASQDLYYSQVGIFNLHISGSVIDTSTVVHTLNIEQCRIANNGQIFWQNSSADNRTRLEQVTLLHASTGAGTAPLMQFSSGLATLGLLDVTGRDNAPLLQFDGTGKLQVCGLSTFESTTTSTIAAPIVYIAPTSATGYSYAFGYNSFSYSSQVSRAFSSGKNCGIVCEAGTGHPTLIITYNAFNLLLCNATCFVVQDVKKADALAYTTINFFSNCSTYLATGIDSTHKTTLAAVA